MEGVCLRPIDGFGKRSKTRLCDGDRDPRAPYTTSNAMFAACAAGGQWERALELLDELEEPTAVC